MINETYVLHEAKCDGCGKDLIYKLNEKSLHANHATLKFSFGYGSPLDDDCKRYHLCEACTFKALSSVGIRHEMACTLCGNITHGVLDKSGARPKVAFFCTSKECLYYHHTQTCKKAHLSKEDRKKVKPCHCTDLLV